MSAPDDTTDSANTTPALPEDPPPAHKGPPGGLPGSVTAAAVLLLIFGTLAGLGAVLILFTTVLFSAVPYSMPYDMFGDPNCLYANPGIPCNYPMMGGWEPDMGAFWFLGLAFVGLIALLGAAVAGGHVAAGVAILKRRGWGRILGMVVSGAALIVVVLGFASMMTAAMLPVPAGFEDIPGYGKDYYDATMAASIAFGVVFGALVIATYAYILWVLARRGDAFD